MGSRVHNEMIKFIPKGEWRDKRGVLLPNDDMKGEGNMTYGLTNNAV